MRKFAALGLSAAVVLSLAIAPSAQAKVKVTKPAAPTVVSISSSPVKKGKVNITVSIVLPTNTGGAKITGSKVSAGAKSCTITQTKTSCTIKGITNGKALNVIAQTKNKKGFSARSVGIRYVAGAAAFSAAVTPAAPTVVSISSSPVKKGKVNVTFAITLPTNTGGAKITGSKVSAGAKSCTITQTKTSCTIKGITNGKALNVIAQTKNKKGFSAKSVGIRYVAGAAAFSAAVTPAAPVVSVVTATPTVNAVISSATIGGLDVPIPGASVDTSVSSGVGYTASVTWSGALTSDNKLKSNTQYTATISLTATAGYTLTGVAANFFTVAGANSVTNGANSGVVTAVFPSVVYSVGGIGPAGGIIFMTPSTQGGLGGDSYYEAAPTGWGNGIAVNPSITIDGISFAAEITGTSTTDPQLRWCNNPTATVGVTSTAIGTGKANTAAIVSGGDVNCTLGAGFTADGYTSTGATPYSDWFLPSFDEINQLCRYAGEAAQSTEPCSNSGSLRVGFVAASFGSSSEYNPSQKWIQSFATAGSGGGSKGATSYIRPVRSFQ